MLNLFQHLNRCYRVAGFTPATFLYHKNIFTALLTQKQLNTLETIFQINLLGLYLPPLYFILQKRNTFTRKRYF